MEKVIEVKPISIEFIKEIGVSADKMLATTKELKITTQDNYVGASDILKTIKATSKDIVARRKAITVPLDTAKKSVMDLFRTPIESLVSAEIIIKDAMVGYTDEQERLRIVEQDKLDRQARAEEDRKKRALDAKIEKAKADGNEDKVEELQEKKEEVSVAAPIVAPKTETPTGISYKTVWDFKVVDATKVPREYLIVNEQMLRKFAGATKGKIAVPGVEFTSRKEVASRSK